MLTAARPREEEVHLHGRADAVVDVGGARVEDEAVGAIFGDDVDQLVGDLLQRLVPAEPLPASRAPLSHALHRVADAGGVVHLCAVRAARRTAPRIEVGDVGELLGIVGVLLLAPDDAVLHVGVVGAGRDAVDPKVRDVDDVVPGPLVAVDVLPSPILVGSRHQIPEASLGIDLRETAKTRNGRGAGIRHDQPPYRGPKLQLGLASRNMISATSGYGPGRRFDRLRVSGYDIGEWFGPLARRSPENSGYHSHARWE